MVIDIVGSSKLWWDWEEANGICHECSGDGTFSSTGYEDGIITECTTCRGTGKVQDDSRE